MHRCQARSQEFLTGNRPIHNRNPRTSKALLKSQAHQGTSLFTSAVTNQRGLPKGSKRTSGPISRITAGDRIAVKMGVVQVEKVNDQMGQGIGVFEEMRF